MRGYDTTKNNFARATNPCNNNGGSTDPPAGCRAGIVVHCLCGTGGGVECVGMVRTRDFGSASQMMIED